jgi:cobalt-zinc-cadmium efflux system outer membrane protein
MIAIASISVVIGLRSLCAQTVPAWTLQRVVDSYVENNLELQAAEFRLDRARADLIAARVRQNPSITFTAENLPVSGPTPFGRLYEIGMTYSETIELGGKRALRERAADSSVSVVEAQFEDTMRRGIAEVKRLYFEAVLARYYLETANENRETFDQLARFTTARFQEGAIPELDLIKVRLERIKFDSALKHAELGLRQSVIRLREKLGSQDTGPQEIAGELAMAPIRPELSTLRQVALNERSDVLVALAEVSAATDRVALERGRAKADINPFAGYKRVGNDNTLLFGVNVPLKTRDRNEAEISRAETDVRSAEVRLQIVRNHVAAEIESAYARLQIAQELVDTFQNGLLEQADESRTISVAAYEEGGTELLPVLDAQRTRSEIREEYFKTLFEYRASIVALELAVGREIQP